MTWMSSTRRW